MKCLRMRKPLTPNKMELQLKHLVYQSFKPLKVYFGKNDIDVIQFIDYENGIVGVLNKNKAYLLQDNPFKLILKPLFDLKGLSSRDLKSKYRISDEVIFWIQELNERNAHIEDINVECYHFLIENHFDIFGLIDEGLAVSEKIVQK